MMLYLATLTIMLAWYGLLCIRNRRDHGATATALNLFLQAAVFVTAANCMLRGHGHCGNPIMMGISVVGLTAAMLNTRFILRRNPPLNEWLIQHTRGLVGAGISVYTAFLAFRRGEPAAGLRLQPGRVGHAHGARRRPACCTTSGASPARGAASARPAHRCKFQLAGFSRRQRNTRSAM